MYCSVGHTAIECMVYWTCTAPYQYIYHTSLLNNIRFIQSDAGTTSTCWRRGNSAKIQPHRALIYSLEHSTHTNSVYTNTKNNKPPVEPTQLCRFQKNAPNGCTLCHRLLRIFNSKSNTFSPCVCSIPPIHAYMWAPSPTRHSEDIFCWRRHILSTRAWRD